MTIEATDIIVTFMNDYLFDTTWSEPGEEYRENIKLIAHTICYDNVVIGPCTIPLPVLGVAYQIYEIPNGLFGGFDIRNITSWESLASFINNHNIDLRFLSEEGLLLWRENIHVIANPYTGAMIVAIDRKMMIDIVGRTYPLENIYVGVYYDSDEIDVLQLEHYRVNLGSDLTLISERASLADLVFINGGRIDYKRIEQLAITDAYIELVFDENIKATIDIDITTIDSSPTYVNANDEACYLLHIPKEFGIDNQIVTHNTCDLYVSWHTGFDNRDHGRFVKRNLNGVISQVTHNDYGILVSHFDNLRNLPDITHIGLHMVVRTHSKQNYIIRDKNYIDILYEYHSDNDIISMLTGTHQSSFEFWHAKHLEQSTYVKMFLEQPKTIDESNLPTYIDALGYFNAITLISPRVQRFIIPSEDGIDDRIISGFDGHLLINIPPALRGGMIYLNVCINGVKLDDIYISACIQQDFAKLSLRPPLTFKPGDVVIVEVFESFPSHTIKTLPTWDEHRIEIATRDFTMYEVVERILPSKGVNVDFYTTYIEVDPVSVAAFVVNLWGTEAMTFKESAYDKEFIICYNTGFRKVDFHLDDYLKQGKPLVFNLESLVDDTLVESTFSVNVHADYSSAVGTVIDHTDPNNVSDAPVWRILNQTSYFENNESTILTTWRPTLGVDITSATMSYVLAEEHKNVHYIAGYRVGTIRPNNYDPTDIQHLWRLPTKFVFSMDGGIIHSIENIVWREERHSTKTFMFDSPILMKDGFGLQIADSIKGDEIELDYFEPIFVDPQYNPNVPIMGDIKPIVYLNGRELLEDVDFAMLTIRDEVVEPGVNHIAGRQLVVNNVSYMQAENNKLEVLLTSNTVLARTNTFLEQDTLYPRFTNAYWFNELGMVTADGYATKNIATEYGDVKLNSSMFRNGALCGTRTIVPKRSMDFISQYHEDDDTPIVEQITNYLTPTFSRPPSIMLDYQHRLVSVYLMVIHYDLATGKLRVENLEDDEDFLNQFSDYEHLIRLDTLLQGNLDLGYVDIQHAFIEMTTNSVETYKISKRLMSLVLPTDMVIHKRYDHEPGAKDRRAENAR